MTKKLTHISESGDVNMVDVSHKAITTREALAQSKVTFPEDIFQAIREGGFQTKKGGIVQTSILAGINATKKTSDLITLCHNLPISKVDIQIEPIENGFEINCQVKTTAQTGVEMEALTGASVAALCIYDMSKALSHDIVIGPTKLMSKKGGKRDFTR